MKRPAASMDRAFAKRRSVISDMAERLRIPQALSITVGTHISVLDAELGSTIVYPAIDRGCSRVT